MTTQTISATLDGLVEELAEIEHERWAHWQRYMHSKAIQQADGSLLIPAELVSKWQSQIERSYAELNDSEKESDREQVRKYIPTIVKRLSAEGVR